MRPRVLATVAATAGLGAVPALAALLAPRQAPAPAQISLNTTVPAFAVGGMIPGDSVTRCVRVRNEGDQAIGLVSGVVIEGALAPYLRVTAAAGSGLGDDGPSCTGFRPEAAAFGTAAPGSPVAALRPAIERSWPARAERSYAVRVALPSDAPREAMAKQATVTLAFAGFPLEGAGGETPPPPDLPGGLAPGTTGGFDKEGNFLTNAQIKRRLRVGKARLLKNGNIRVRMRLPAGGAIRAKAILPDGVYYAHTLLPVEWGPRLTVLLERREVGRQAVRSARRSGRKLTLRITTRYRWAHGPHAFVQPEQKLVAVRKKGRRPR